MTEEVEEVAAVAVEHLVDQTVLEMPTIPHDAPPPVQMKPRAKTWRWTKKI